MDKPLFKAGHLESWKGVSPSDWQDIVKDIVGVFNTTISGMISELDQAIKAKDRPAVRMSSHSLKSCYGNVGGEYVQSLFAQIEAISMDGDWDQIRDIRYAIEEKRAETEKSINEYVGKI